MKTRASSNYRPAQDTYIKMDRMYRFQRYFYDLTRKYYLLGRDRLLSQIVISEGERVLEVGCGTARNLIILARRKPEAHFYGIDASIAMLETAEKHIRSACVTNIELETALAGDFEFDKTFDLGEKFDKSFFSFSISMIPSWQESIDNALRNLKIGGELFIIDFYDQEQLPTAFQKMLKGWLKRFQVTFWERMIPYLRSLEGDGQVYLTITPLFRRYSFIAAIEKRRD